ncbi:hypothetical protein CASFOL_003099 [Castilleja foliolosa]|uniref:Peroxidase n=1 Tax=Castilleja foliolosa TaxID=1961234 RepID=A0ABD3EGH0_9LAMI
MAPSLYRVNITLTILTMLLISSSANKQLDPFFYLNSCPQVLYIVHQVVQEAIEKEPRMGASLLRLHFHDCFVNGCDGSVLLDDNGSFKGEKSAGPNMNSLRGFDVVDNIKSELESQCPGVVSCADILALAASESVFQLGGIPWNFLGNGLALGLGRRDARTASQAAANKSLPAPTLDLNGLISSFKNVGLSKHDLIVLSGAHTIGQARCISFKNRVYNETKTKTIDNTFAQTLQNYCPSKSGKGDNKLAALDISTPDKFDNSYYANLVDKKGLLHSDQQLYNTDDMTNSIVMKYIQDPFAFYLDFAVSMIKMSEIRPLVGDQGEIRENCRKPN